MEAGGEQKKDLVDCLSQSAALVFLPVSVDVPTSHLCFYVLFPCSLLMHYASDLNTLAGRERTSRLLLTQLLCTVTDSSAASASHVQHTQHPTVSPGV